MAGPDDATFVEKYLKIQEDLAKELDKICAQADGFGNEISYVNCLIKDAEDSDAKNVVGPDYFKPEYRMFVEKYANTDIKNLTVLYVNGKPTWKSQNPIIFCHASDVEKANIRQWLGIGGGNEPGDGDLEINFSFWSMMKTEFGKSSDFYRKCFFRNYCPFAFSNNGQQLSFASLPSGNQSVKEIGKKCHESCMKVIDLWKKAEMLHIIILGKFKQCIQKGVDSRKTTLPWPTIVQTMGHPAYHRGTNNSWIEEAQAMLRNNDVIVEFGNQEVEEEEEEE